MSFEVKIAAMELEFFVAGSKDTFAVSLLTDEGFQTVKFKILNNTMSLESGADEGDILHIATAAALAIALNNLSGINNKAITDAYLPKIDIISDSADIANDNDIALAGAYADFISVAAAA